MKHQPQYLLDSSEGFQTFKFISEGPKGSIPKIIIFSDAEVKDYYYLGFGDYNETTGFIDDEVVSNNGDPDKILATVVEAIFIFIKNNPNAKIFATGSTPVRTRMYQINISKYLEEAEILFTIVGDYNGVWEIFQKNRNYNAFVIQKK